MSLFSRLLGGKPQAPPVSDEAGVVEWFLKYDDKIADFRSKFPSMLEKAKQEILADLRDNPDASSLKAFMDKVSQFYSQLILPKAASMQQQVDSLSDEDREGFVNIMFFEAMVASKMRILGYFLLKKYGIQPE